MRVQGGPVLHCEIATAIQLMHKDEAQRMLFETFSRNDE